MFEQVEVLHVADVVAARDDLVAAVLLARDLGDDDVVLVVSGDGDDHVGALDTCALEHPEFGAVAEVHDVFELRLKDRVATSVVLDQRDLVALGHQLTREVQSDFSATGDDHVHG